MQAQAGLGLRDKLWWDADRKVMAHNWIDDVLALGSGIALFRWKDAFRVASELSLDTGKRHKVYSIVFHGGERGWKIKEADISGAS
ncbi:gp049 [Rhodococcus phage ReqiDocB7]|uniref:gp049 n=1 Tax=Rhodococcus phage ReqiDocB7 TaxID=691966 RepID=UPI0001CDD773|nr:gp049 [Rhodococcus phage ReqiDocB7]ADD80835.1 gp049 [Rhodococcus phage ReqiDocB7]